MQAFTRRRLKRVAWAGVSSGTAYSADTCVPKSLVTLPMAINQHVVADRSRRRDLAPLIVDSGAEVHLLGGAINRDHLAEAIP